MIPGLKIGLRDWKKKLEAAHPPFVEVYFRTDKIPEYREMFDYLKSHNIKFGLHFWGVLKSQIEPNLLSTHKWIQNQSYFEMRKAIQAGVAEKAVYVNVHTGSFKERLLNLDKGTFQLAKLKETEPNEGRKNLLKNACRLRDYLAKFATNTILTFETVPLNCPVSWIAPRGPDNLLLAAQCPIEFYEDLMREGLYVANDFGHTASSIVSDDHEEVWKFVLDWTKRLAPATKLIHCNSTVPPFDGVDTHLGILPEDFERKPLPNKSEMIELLKIFKNREDVYILNEPEEKHVANYIELCKILDAIRQLN